MAMRLVRRNARNVPWITEEALAPARKQSSINHVIGPRMSKPYFPSKVPDNRILRGYCGAKGSGRPGPFRIISPRAQPRRKTSKDVWGRPTATRRNRRGTSCPRQLVSWEERTIRHPPQPSPSSPNEGTSVEGQLWEHGERTIVEELVISALNACSWQSGRINEGMTPKQCHAVHYNSQQVEGNAGWEWRPTQSTYGRSRWREQKDI